MTASVFTSCSDDDDAPEVGIPIDDELAGVYNGDFEINVNGLPVSEMTDQEITVSKASDTSINLILKNFSIPIISVPLGDIEMKDCQVVEDGDRYSFTGTTTMENTTIMLTAQADAEGTIGGGNIEVNLDINASLMGSTQAVTVVYNGTKK